MPLAASAQQRFTGGGNSDDDDEDFSSTANYLSNRGGGTTLYDRESFSTSSDSEGSQDLDVEGSDTDEKDEQNKRRKVAHLLNYGFNRVAAYTNTTVGGAVSKPQSQAPDSSTQE